jgi:hypothetical protein
MSTISHQSIRNNPSNNSPSKISYGFSKTRRFINHNPEYIRFFILGVQQPFMLMIVNYQIEKQDLDMELNQTSLKIYLLVLLPQIIT